MLRMTRASHDAIRAALDAQASAAWRRLLALAVLFCLAAAEPIAPRFAASTAWRLYRSRDLENWDDLGAPLVLAGEEAGGQWASRCRWICGSGL